MEMASFTGFIRVIFIMVLIWYAFKFLLRIFAPIIMQKAATKMQEKMQEKMGDHMNRQNSGRNPFENTTNSSATKKEFPTEKKKVGEYVDFEEIE